MTYIEGFVIACPTANKQEFIEHARKSDAVFIENGAARVVECWGDEVPEGKVTDFRRAVKAEADESVVFSCMEWPSRAACDKANDAMMNGEVDPMPEGMEMPFDGKRMIFGGFTRIVEMGG